ncbi:MAG: OmpA family protein [Bacteroidales bacterium]|nr:OmpA family protein [Bacteroidales bacterium]
MKKHFRILLTIALSAFAFALHAQDEDEGDPCTQNYPKTVAKQVQKARDLQKSGKKSDANVIYYEILEEYPDHLEVNYYLALSYFLPVKINGWQVDSERDAKKGIEAANRLANVCPEYKIEIHYYAARIAWLIEDWQSAIKHAQILLDNPDLVKDEEQLEHAEQIIKSSKSFAELLGHPVPFDPKPVPGISTQHDEYLATISPDAGYFYFTRRMPYTKQGAFGNETSEREYFSYSHQLADGSYETGKPLPYPFNEASGEGSPTINLANDLLIYAAVHEAKIKDEQGKEYTYPNYDLYSSKWDGSDWSDPRPLSNINREDSWESQPTLSSDGNILFFASDRPGGYGGSDIWMSERDANGNWQSPVNLGPIINSKGNERSPFLHTDSRTLYFSSSPSNDRPGIGGMDIFYSKLDEKGKWTKPVNIGYPINSENDDVDFFVSLDGKTAYFSSNNLGADDWNIYSFELYEEARPKSMVIVKGVVNTDDHELVSAVVELRDENSEIIATTTANANTGQYAVATQVDTEKPQNLIVNIKQDGYAYDTKMVTINPEPEPVITSDAEVKRIEVGKVCDLHDIYFATNSYTLTDESKRLIDLFADFLEHNPTVKAEIQGHTDNVGNDNDNLVLSDRRAQSVYNYLIEKGIPKNRIRFKGYGESKPIAPNTTEEGRAKNRRTVFLIYER